MTVLFLNKSERVKRGSKGRVEGTRELLSSVDGGGKSTHETLGFFAAQARARAAWVHPNLVAKTPIALTLSSFTFPSGVWRALMVSPKKFALVTNRLSVGIESLYFPVRRPLSRGDQTVVPYL